MSVFQREKGAQFAPQQNQTPLLLLLCREWAGSMAGRIV